jgi:hypothetical protein
MREHVLCKLRGGLALIVATLREVFDEAPYARFLARSGMHSSREAYALFLSEDDRVKARRPRCC